MTHTRPSRKSRRLLALCAALSLVAAANSAIASVQMFIQDFSGWQDAAGAYSTCDFTGFAPNTFITDQYAALGVNFTNVGPNVVTFPTWDLFPQDSAGIDGNNGIILAFDQPIHAIGQHGPGAWRFRLYSGGQQFFVSSWWTGATNVYSGLYSDVAFDGVYIESPGDDVYSDNIYFSTIPAPGAIALAALSGLPARRRRR